ncbi:MAG: transcriptional repressor [Clostridia bacterium]|nr:transcriptional repressor [Clostridia bacterium]
MASKRNFSAKREAIYNTLASTTSHPTADWIYDQLKQQMPDLSLGTVYRNLNIFKEMGIIKSIGVINGQERFDANVSQHSHFICSKCFKIIDIPSRKRFIDSSIYEYVEFECRAKISSHSITFYGICSECGNSENY